MIVNEDKVKRPLGSLDRIAALEAAVMELNPGIHLGEFTPEKPEIPEGCPVLYWLSGDERTKAIGFYDDNEVLEFDNVEIDYQRKGHVIPWNGGECPVGRGSIISVFIRSGVCKSNTRASSYRWDHAGWETDILAYVIWPEWVK